MKSGTSFLIGGLLQGLGKGITNQHEERRQNALLALKRQYDVADRETAAATAEAAAVSNDARDQQNRLGIVEATAAADVAKAGVASRLKNAEREVDYGYDVKLETVKSTLDMKKDAASKAAAAAIAAGEVQSTRIGDNGELVLVYKNGTASVAQGVPKLNLPKGGDDEAEGEGTIAGARNRQGGAPATPKPTLPSFSTQEENVLLTRYANATRQTAPFMFDKNGNKYPLATVKRMMQGRLAQ